MRAASVSEALAKRVRLPGLRRCEGLGTVGKAVHLGMRGLRSADLGDSRHGDARQQAAAHRLVHRDPSSYQPFKRHLGLAASGPARAAEL